MPQPTWRKIIDRKKIPAEQGTAWTQVLDYVTPGKLMKIEVVIDDKANPPIKGKWKPSDFQDECTADGDYSGKEPLGKQQRTDTLLSNAPLGALIGRIGGSTADKSVDSAVAPATPTRVVFSVGRYCVFMVPPNPNGALYLGVNDNGANMLKLSGDLVVDIFEAL